jgi:hypothetical protein
MAVPGLPVKDQAVDPSPSDKSFEALCFDGVS